MSFSADWLALRRRADDHARDKELLNAVVRLLGDKAAPRILDLGSGTGANMKTIAPALDRDQTWILADNDPSLLSGIEVPTGVAAVPTQVDLSGDLSALFDPAPHLVTASAFFDLCGPTIADQIVAATASAQAIFYTALTYDGREEWTPADSRDHRVLDRFIADQRRDKGLGPALGPDATSYLADAFRRSGYAVTLATSDWDLRPPVDAPMIAALAEGHASAARSALGPVANEWADARAAADQVVVGHQDLLAVPPD